MGTFQPNFRWDNAGYDLCANIWGEEWKAPKEWKGEKEWKGASNDWSGGSTDAWVASDLIYFRHKLLQTQFFTSFLQESWQLEHVFLLKMSFLYKKVMFHLHDWWEQGYVESKALILLFTARFRTLQGRKFGQVSNLTRYECDKTHNNMFWHRCKTAS